VNRRATEVQERNGGEDVPADLPPTGEPPELPARRSPDLRASDADRDRVIDVLRAATADGRLTADEFSERMEPP
jgi:hypothetical protein